MKLSIITPNYNYSEFLPKLFESIINQNFSNWEHIIVDDGSTDTSVEVIKSYVSKYPDKITLIQQENKGQSKAINRALKEVRGDIIGWINSDDFFCENIFKQIVKIFEQEKDTEIIYGNYNIVDINGGYIKTKKHLKFNYFEAVYAGFGNCLTSNAVFWRNKLNNDVGPFREDLKSNMDGEFFSRLTYNRNLKHANFSIANFRQQAISIAGKQDSNWGELVRKEKEIEYIQSYNNLFLSKVINYNKARMLLYPVILIRKIKKIILLYGR